MHIDKKGMRFSTDKQFFSMRIAKKKNGKPNTDYPSKTTFVTSPSSYFFIEVDVSQQIGQIDFTQFCIVYTPEGISSVHGEAGVQHSQKRVLEVSSSSAGSSSHLIVTPAPKKLSDGKLREKLTNE